MNSDPIAEIRSLAAGVRSITLVFTLALGYFNLRIVAQIDQFRVIFADLLGGENLPTITTLILQMKTALMGLSLLLPLAAIAITFLVRNHRWALFAISVIIVLIFIQIHFVWVGLFAPLTTIMTSLGQSK